MAASCFSVCCCCCSASMAASELQTSKFRGGNGAVELPTVHRNAAPICGSVRSDAARTKAGVWKESNSKIGACAFGARTTLNKLHVTVEQCRTTRQFTICMAEPYLISKLNSAEQTYKELSVRLADPDVANDPSEYQKIAKSVSELEEVVTTYKKFKECEIELEGARELGKTSGNDRDLAEMAAEEVNLLTQQLNNLEERLKVLLLPSDPLDARNIMLEVRAGTGGDEAAIWAGDLVDEVEVMIDPKDIELTTARSGGAGGSIYLEEYKDDIGRCMLWVWISRHGYEIKLREQQEKISSQRRLQVGTGARSEKIRTYNYKDNRVTDHRTKINFDLTSFINGDIEGAVQSCAALEQKELLEELLPPQIKQLFKCFATVDLSCIGFEKLECCNL